ncbi:aldehyde dehydrogenase [Curvibacter sp. CHRR-16]|uniref:aldehyde dehydrogenase n=1 Tax=Curvibacter sp. CHRR-16 TaxID=2835872 RepID=UPI001BD92564|nr:aldehyde dehydrogenase [Curvibacter sp. CHRR-16]MBT0571171.1 aldehyde dehydrogenase [Curvibacter sp. CHRR-16]
MSSSASLQLDGRAFIHGQRCAALSGQTFDDISPVDGRIICQVADGDAPDIDAAVAAARRAFNDRRWAGQAPAQRKKIMLQWADLIAAHADELALMETLDMGKPVRYAKSVDVRSTVNCIRWYAEACDKVYDEIAPTGDAALALITREALGVVGVIVPWNYPMIMAAWKLGPALASGNSVVLKPSEKSPLTALRLAELAVQAGLPEGVFNVVPGTGPKAGTPLALHMDVDCIAFTGSTRVGKQIHVMAGQSNLKRAWTELGGKSPNIVFADCPDLQAAVDAAASAMFFNQGQSCNAPSRLLLQDGIYDQFVERLQQRLQDYQPADPRLPETTMGALVDNIQLQTVMGYIQSGLEQGAQLLGGGQQALQNSGGFYVEPTVFAGVSPSMRIAREEIFGPVLGVFRFTDAQQAVSMANDSSYGLNAGVWTADINKAHTVARMLRVGTVHVNSYDEDDITVPFGGFKQSGIGRDKSLHAFDKYTELKTTWIKLRTVL